MMPSSINFTGLSIDPKTILCPQRVYYPDDNFYRIVVDFCGADMDCICAWIENNFEGKYCIFQEFGKFFIFFEHEYEAGMFVLSDASDLAKMYRKNKF